MLHKDLKRVQNLEKIRILRRCQSLNQFSLVDVEILVNSFYHVRVFKRDSKLEGVLYFLPRSTIDIRVFELVEVLGVFAGLLISVNIH